MNLHLTFSLLSEDTIDSVVDCGRSESVIADSCSSSACMVPQSICECNSVCSRAAELRWKVLWNHDTKSKPDQKKGNVGWGTLCAASCSLQSAWLQVSVGLRTGVRPRNSPHSYEGVLLQPMKSESFFNKHTSISEQRNRTELSCLELLEHRNKRKNRVLHLSNFSCQTTDLRVK
jgi:hypothetical protein